MLVFLDWKHRTNRHTRHMAKQNIHLKNSVLVVLDWTHKTNGKTRHMANKHIHQKDSRLPFFEWTQRTNRHTSHMAKENIHSKNSKLVFLDWTLKTNNNQGIWPNNIFIKRILGFLYQTGHTRQTDTQDKQTHKSYGRTKHSFKEFYACLFRLDRQDK